MPNKICDCLDESVMFLYQLKGISNLVNLHMTPLTK